MGVSSSVVASRRAGTTKPIINIALVREQMPRLAQIFRCIEGGFEMLKRVRRFSSEAISDPK